MKAIIVKMQYKGFRRVEHRGLTLINYFVKTDQKRLQQVLLNIYSNAIKFTGRDGKISLVVELIQVSE